MTSESPDGIEKSPWFMIAGAVNKSKTIGVDGEAVTADQKSGCNATHRKPGARGNWHSRPLSLLGRRHSRTRPDSARRTTRVTQPPPAQRAFTQYEAKSRSCLEVSSNYLGFLVQVFRSDCSLLEPHTFRINYLTFSWYSFLVLYDQARQYSWHPWASLPGHAQCDVLYIDCVLYWSANGQCLRGRRWTDGSISFSVFQFNAIQR